MLFDPELDNAAVVVVVVIVIAAAAAAAKVVVAVDDANAYEACATLKAQSAWGRRITERRNETKTDLPLSVTAKATITPILSANDARSPRIGASVTCQREMQGATMAAGEDQMAMATAMLDGAGSA